MYSQKNAYFEVQLEIFLAGNPLALFSKNCWKSKSIIFIMHVRSIIIIIIIIVVVVITHRDIITQCSLIIMIIRYYTSSSGIYMLNPLNPTHWFAGHYSPFISMKFFIVHLFYLFLFYFIIHIIMNKSNNLFMYLEP